MYSYGALSTTGEVPSSSGVKADISTADISITERLTPTNIDEWIAPQGQDWFWGLNCPCPSEMFIFIAEQPSPIPISPLCLCLRLRGYRVWSELMRGFHLFLQNSERTGRHHIGSAAKLQVSECSAMKRWIINDSLQMRMFLVAAPLLNEDLQPVMNKISATCPSCGLFFFLVILSVCMSGKKTFLLRCFACLVSPKTKATEATRDGLLHEATVECAFPLSDFTSSLCFWIAPVVIQWKISAEAENETWMHRWYWRKRGSRPENWHRTCGRLCRGPHSSQRYFADIIYILFIYIILLYLSTFCWIHQALCLHDQSIPAVNEQAVGSKSFFCWLSWRSLGVILWVGPERRQQQTLGSGLLSVQRSLHCLHEAREGLAEQDGPLCVTVWRFRNGRGEVDTPVV